jgi:NADP-dependent alcohol dehydrogenase
MEGPMNNFTFFNPTRIVFGKGTIPELSKLVPPGAKILLTYGGGSIMKNGVYERIKKALSGFKIVEFGGIEPNPLYETCMKAVELAKKEKIDFILAAGGGSVIDGTKFISAAINYQDGDPWDILLKLGSNVKSAVPFGTVLTLPATGSEMNKAAVISKAATAEKLFFTSEHVFPKFSILDPEVTYSLPPRQIANGVVDAFVHVVEQYLTCGVSAPLQDRQAEAVLSTLVERGPLALAEPENYDVRADVMWCATQALNGVFACGKVEDWSTHMIGHELTAFYGIDHAVSLAVILPSNLRVRAKLKKSQIIQMGRRVFGVEETGKEAVEKTVRRVEKFFKKMGMKPGLAALGVDAKEAAAKVGERFTERGTVLGEAEDITPAVAAKIILGAK